MKIQNDVVCSRAANPKELGSIFKNVGFWFQLLALGPRQVVPFCGAYQISRLLMNEEHMTLNTKLTVAASPTGG